MSNAKATLLTFDDSAWVAVYFFALVMAFAEAVFFYTSIWSQAAFMGFAVAFGAIALMGLLRDASIMANRYVTAAIVVALVTAMVPIIVGVEHGYYYARDCIVSLLLVCAALTIHRHNASYFIKLLLLSCYCYIGVSVVAFLIGGTMIGRYESPELIIAPFLVYKIKSTESINIKLGYAAIAALMLYFSYASGERTTVLLFAFSLFFTIALYVQSLRRKLMVLSIGTLSLVLIAYYTDLISLLSDTRFRKLMEGRIDGSLMARLNEVSDAYNEWLHLDFLRQLIGSGAGSFFTPDTVASDKLVVYTGEGMRIHHIHSTPAFLLLRNGVLGVAIYFYVYGCVIRSLLGSKTTSGASMFVSNVMFLYLTYGLLFYLFAMPVFWLILSAQLFLWSSRRVRKRAYKTQLST